MAITNSTIADLVPSEKILGATVNDLLLKSNPLILSGLAATGPEVVTAANGGPRKVSLPYINALDASQVNYGTDDINQAGSVGKLTAAEYSALRMDMNYGWGVADLARMVTTFDAKGGIAAGLAQYWNTIYSNNAVAMIKGAVQGASLTTGVGTVDLSASVLIDSKVTAGEFADQFDILICSPFTKGKLEKLNAGNTYVYASDAKIAFDTFAGFKVIVSNKMTDGISYIARSGALAFGEGQPAGMVPLEIERVANGGNGQGAEILHSRRSAVIHPQGFSFAGAVTAPTVASGSAGALDHAATWTLAVPVENVGFRKIIHKAT